MESAQLTIDFTILHYNITGFREMHGDEERMDMENERTTEKKQVLRNFIWATMFLSILLFAVMGILFYMLIPKLQILPISPNTKQLLLFAASFLSLAALFTWIFGYRPALKKYKREYKEELEKLEKSKMGIFLSNRAFYVFLFLLILLGAVIGWYFGDRIFE